MKKFLSISVLGVCALGLSGLTGCYTSDHDSDDRIISRDEKTSVSPDGSVRSKETVVKQERDGSVTKEETRIRKN